VKLSILTGTGGDSPRSGRQHKAWGVSPRIALKRSEPSPRSGRQPDHTESVQSAKSIARFAGSTTFRFLILGLTPQALCWRPLRGLKQGLFIHSVLYSFMWMTNLMHCPGSWTQGW